MAEVINTAQVASVWRTLVARGVLLTISAPCHSTGAPQLACGGANWRRAVLRLIRRAGQCAGRCAQGAWCGRVQASSVCVWVARMRRALGIMWEQDDSSMVMRLEHAVLMNNTVVVWTLHRRRVGATAL